MTKVVNIRDHIPPVDFVKEGIIVSLWSRRFDTWEIARKVDLREWQVANLLARMKEGKK